MTTRTPPPRFQFPSNGKVYSELIDEFQDLGDAQAEFVSIPFKRESVFRGTLAEQLKN